MLWTFHCTSVAQEVQTVFPELVHADSGGKLSVEYSALVPIIVEALKTQREEMDVVKSEVFELRRRLSELESQSGSSRAEEGQRRHTQQTEERSASFPTHPPYYILLQSTFTWRVVRALVRVPVTLRSSLTGRCLLHAWSRSWDLYQNYYTIHTTLNIYYLHASMCSD